MNSDAYTERRSSLAQSAQRRTGRKGLSTRALSGCSMSPVTMLFAIVDVVTRHLVARARDGIARQLLEAKRN